MKEIVLEGLENLEEYLGELVSTLEETAGRFRRGEEQGANQSYVPCVEGLQLLVGLMDNVRQAQRQGIVALREPLFVRQEPRLLDLLKEIVQAQDDRDWIFLADLLGYELVPLLRELRAELPALKQELG